MNQGRVCGVKVRVVVISGHDLEGGICGGQEWEVHGSGQVLLQQVQEAIGRFVGRLVNICVLSWIGHLAGGCRAKFAQRRLQAKAAQIDRRQSCLARLIVIDEFQGLELVPNSEKVCQVDVYPNFVEAGHVRGKNLYDGLKRGRDRFHLAENLIDEPIQDRVGFQLNAHEMDVRDISEFVRISGQVGLQAGVVEVPDKMQMGVHADIEVCRLLAKAQL